MGVDRSELPAPPLALPPSAKLSWKPRAHCSGLLAVLSDSAGVALSFDVTHWITRALIRTGGTWILVTARSGVPCVNEALPQLQGRNSLSVLQHIKHTQPGSPSRTISTVRFLMMIWAGDTACRRELLTLCYWPGCIKRRWMSEWPYDVADSWPVCCGRSGRNKHLGLISVARDWTSANCASTYCKLE